MPTPKICREHAWKCIRTAETLPPGDQIQAERVVVDGKVEGPIQGGQVHLGTPQSGQFVGALISSRVFTFSGAETEVPLARRRAKISFAAARSSRVCLLIEAPSFLRPPAI
jgi:hypothetical protein